MSPETVLVDTSAWILSFKKSGNAELKAFLIESVRSGAAATSPVVILELLQGCRSEAERDSLKEKLESLPVLPLGPSAWERAYDLGFTLRRQGLTIPTVDLIIAATAIESNSALLHHDKHFEMIARYSALKVRVFARFSA